MPARGKSGEKAPWRTNGKLFLAGGFVDVVTGGKAGGWARGQRGCKPRGGGLGAHPENWGFGGGGTRGRRHISGFPFN